MHRDRADAGHDPPAPAHHHRREDPFTALAANRGISEEAIDAARVFAARASVVLTDALAYADARHQHDQLLSALETRIVIERARGVTMGRAGATADQTLRHLRGRAQTTDCRLHQVVADLVRAAQRTTTGGKRR